MGIEKIRFQESATSPIAPSGQCQAYLPYGQEGVLVQPIAVEDATGLLAKRCAPKRYREFGVEHEPTPQPAAAAPLAPYLPIRPGHDRQIRCADAPVIRSPGSRFAAIRKAL